MKHQGKLKCELTIIKTQFFQEDYIENNKFTPYLTFECNDNRYKTADIPNSEPLVFWNEKFDIDLKSPPNNLFF